MTRIEDAAIDLHRLLWNNTGSSDEWPIQIKCDNEFLEPLMSAMNELGAAVKEVCPETMPWPIPHL
jgi:hypothetical protein